MGAVVPPALLATLEFPEPQNRSAGLQTGHLDRRACSWGWLWAQCFFRIFFINLFKEAFLGFCDCLWLVGTVTEMLDSGTEVGFYGPRLPCWDFSLTYCRIVTQGLLAWTSVWLGSSRSQRDHVRFGACFLRTAAPSSVLLSRPGARNSNFSMWSCGQSSSKWPMASKSTYSCLHGPILGERITFVKLT